LLNSKKYVRVRTEKKTEQKMANFELWGDNLLVCNREINSALLQPVMRNLSEQILEYI
jgi:predicted proteasome-type protease